MLTISRFHAAYHVPQGAADPDLLQGRLDKLVRERLPAIIQDELGHAPAGADAYYVVRRLHLSLWLDAMASEDGDVADRWGKLVAGALVRAILYANGDNVRRFEDGASFVATFLSDLMAGQAWTQWAYEEFRPLEGLSVGETASYLLAARPALLVRVAERLAAAGRLKRLIEAIGERDAKLLWDRGLGFGGLQAAQLPADLPAILAGAAALLSFEGVGPVAFACHRLAAYLQLSIARQRYEPDETLASVAGGLAHLHQLMASRAAPQVWRALAAGEIDSPAAIAGFLASLDAGAAPARDWLLTQLSAPGGAANVGLLASALQPSSNAGTEPVPGRGPQVQIVTSAFAGLALLLPSVRDLGIYERGGRDAVYQALLNAVGPDYATLAASDAGPSLLAGIDPGDADRAARAAVSWPEGRASVGGPVEGTGSGQDDRDAGYLPVTLDVLRLFAQRLRGFEASSPDYLARQFLRLPGHLEIGSESLVVTLHQAPLAMILQINGLTGGQGRVPWLDRRELTVNLPQGSP